jgi:hypothetical protein
VGGGVARSAEIDPLFTQAKKLYGNVATKAAARTGSGSRSFKRGL